MHTMQTMRTPHKPSALLLSALILAAPASAQAHSVHNAQGASSPLNITFLDALSLHDGHHQSLVLSPHLNLPQDATGLCWIIPTPAQPTFATSLEPRAFNDLERRIRTTARSAPKPAKGSKKSNHPTATALHAPAAQPLNATLDLKIIPDAGAAALKPLNQWLTSKGCAPLDDAALSYYIERQWSFTAISATAPQGATLTGQAHPPILLSYKAEHATLPLKAPLSAQPFAARYHLLSTQAYSLKSLYNPQARGFEISATLHTAGFSPGQKTPRYTTEPPTLKLEQLPSSLESLIKKPWRPDTTVTAHVLWLSSTEGKGDPTTWIEDLATPTPPETMRLEGTPPAPPTPAAPAPKPAQPPSTQAAPASAPAPPAPHAASCAQLPRPTSPSAPALVFALPLLLMVLRSNRSARKNG